MGCINDLSSTVILIYRLFDETLKVPVCRLLLYNLTTKVTRLAMDGRLAPNTTSHPKQYIITLLSSPFDCPKQSFILECANLLFALRRIYLLYALGRGTVHCWVSYMHSPELLTTLSQNIDQPSLYECF